FMTLLFFLTIFPLPSQRRNGCTNRFCAARLLYHSCHSCKCFSKLIGDGCASSVSKSRLKIIKNSFIAIGMKLAKHTYLIGTGSIGESQVKTVPGIDSCYTQR